MKYSSGHNALLETAPASNRRISILIADGSELYRELLSMVIEELPGLEVLGTAGNGCQVLEMVGARQPQLVLLDLELSGLNGLQSLALIREYYPDTRVIIMTPDGSDAVKETCLVQGAHGVICKRRLHRELRREIAAVFPDQAVGSLEEAEHAECLLTEGL